ncbi:MAG: sigma-70 family RNA polymerase sigma factor [Isosphaerales bacterium]
MLTPFHTPSHANSSDEARASDARVESLVARVRLGDRDVFGELMSLTEPRIRRLLGRLGCRGTDLDDLVQETYLRAWRSLPRFRGESRFSTWLFRIAVNVVRTWRKNRRGVASLDYDESVSMRSHPEFGAVPLLEAYERALSGLSPDLKAVFILHETEGMSYRDVAETLGCPIGTVMSRLHRARVKILDELRERLEELAP